MRIQEDKKHTDPELWGKHKNAPTQKLHKTASNLYGEI
jgi:hypothetical protein